MICIIRHGQTELNSRRIIQGRSDYPLNENGIAQARQASDKLNGIAFDFVYSSPLIRAIQTAKILAPDADPILDGRLVDMDYGPFEGTGIDELPPEALAYFRDFYHNPVPNGMEPIGSVMRRAASFLEERCRTDRNILVVTHAIVMKRLLEHLASGSADFRQRHMGNCVVYRAELLPHGTWSIPEEL